MNVWLIIAVLSGPAIYWIASLGTRYQAIDFEAFHYAGRSIQVDHYIDSTVMYAMQVAVLTLFASWGYIYGIGAMWVPVFWGLGYWLLAVLIEMGKLDSFLKQEHPGTMHQFLADKCRWKMLGVLAAVISLLGILGPAMYEAEFVGQSVARLYVGEGGAVEPLTFWLFVAFIAMAAVYILSGGFQAIVRTDVWQLNIGFSGFSIFTAILLYRIAVEGALIGAVILTGAMLMFSALLLLMWRRQDVKSWSGLFPLLLSVIAYTAAMITMLANTSPTDSIEHFFQVQKFANPLGLGVFSLLSLLIANGLYQLVDVGQWQRLASVSMDIAGFENSRKKLAKSVRYIMFYSPITWMMAIVFGMVLKYLIPEMADPYDAVGTVLAYLWQIYPWLVLLFIVSIVAIMLSTLDSLVAAISFTLHNDCLVAFDQKWRTLKACRVITVLFLLSGMILYTGLASRVGNFADILYTCWAFQIALFPLVMTALFRKTLSASVAFFSLSAGVAASLLPLFSDSLNPYEHGPLLSLLASGLVMIAGNFMIQDTGE